MEGESLRGRRRRASFNSMYDAGDESAQKPGIRAISRSSLSQLDVRDHSSPNARPSTRATTTAMERAQPQDTQQASPAPQSRRGRLTAQEFANNLQHYQRRNRSTSSQSNVHIWRRSGSRDSYGPRSHPRMPENVSVPTRESLEETLSFSSQIDVHPDSVDISQNRTTRDVEVFEQYRLQRFVRRLLHQWCTVASQSQVDHRTMEAMALRIDMETLLRQGFDHWRSAYQQTKRAVETDRFFATLERRASKARDLYLVAKAFTHWAQCASDEGLRTSVARRHILRTKYFNAWREITAVNELKVRRQRLTKFFRIWTKRYGMVCADNTRALAHYHERLVESLYWRWFWRFCERRAPQWRAERMRKKVFSQWVKAVGTCREREAWIEARYTESIQRSSVHRWLERTRIILSCDREAVIFWQRRLIGRLLPEWQTRLRLAPLARQISFMVDWRIARSALSVWVGQVRALRHAAQVDRLRVLRNAWTTWNDALRWRTLAHRIDDRVVLQALYKWVLAQRLILLSRLLLQKSKARVFYTFLDGWRALRTRLDTQEGAVNESRNRRLLSSICGCWQHQLAMSRRKDQIALVFNAPSVTQHALRIWIARSGHMRQLQRWADDAEFYLLATKSVKRWRMATTESKRRKRRDIYTQLRRQVKMNLARRVILPWRERTQVITQMQQYAQDMYQAHLFKVGTNLFDRWRHQLDMVLNMDRHARSLKDASLVQTHLQLWIKGYRQQSTREEQARSYYVGIHVSRIADSLLRKLSLRVFEIGRGQETAESFRDRIEKKRFRNIFRHWQENALLRRFHKPQQALESPRAPRLARFDLGKTPATGSNSRQESGTVSERGFDLEDWIPSLEAQQTTTPLPGYLNTPSKRAAAAKEAIFQMSMTPKTPMTPKGTPFERRLRSQPGTDPLPLARRTQLRRSESQRQSRFEDIKEASPEVQRPMGSG